MESWVIVVLVAIVAVLGLNALETIVTDSRFELDREFKRLDDSSHANP